MRTDQKLFYLKAFLTVFLVILWLLGAAVFGVLLWLRLDYWTNEYLGLDPELYRYLIIIYVFIVVGALITVFGFFGLIGGLLKIKWALVLFLLVLCIATALTIGVVVYGFIYREELENTVARGDLVNKIIKEKYEGYAQRFSQITRSVDIMQSELKCCGADDARDYMQSTWQKLDPKHKDQAPFSCCHDYEKYKNSENVRDMTCPIYQLDSSGNPLPPLNSNINKKGCKKALAEFFENYVIVVAGVAITIVVIELINIIITSILIHVLNNLYVPPQEEIVYDMARNLEKSPYPSRGDYTGSYYR